MRLIYTPDDPSLHGGMHGCMRGAAADLKETSELTALRFN